jgi:hypothetical protein
MECKICNSKSEKIFDNSVLNKYFTDYFLFKMKIIDRLALYIESKGISLNAFDKSIGASNGYIGKQIKNSASVGVDIIQNIISVYNDLSIEWLITGKGDMLKSENILSEPPGTYGNKIIEAQTETISALRKYISMLEEELDKLKSQKEKPAESGQKRKAVS